MKNPIKKINVKKADAVKFAKKTMVAAAQLGVSTAVVVGGVLIAGAVQSKLNA